MVRDDRRAVSRWSRLSRVFGHAPEKGEALVSVFEQDPLPEPTNYSGRITVNEKLGAHAKRYVAKMPLSETATYVRRLQSLAKHLDDCLRTAVPVVDADSDMVVDLLDHDEAAILDTLMVSSERGTLFPYG